MTLTRDQRHVTNMYGTPGSSSGPDNDLTGAGASSDLLTLVRNNRAGLKTLRDDHVEILDNITSDNTDNDDIAERISAVTESLQMLEVGVAESGVMLSLAAHFDMIESERSITKMEMRRVKVGLNRVKYLFCTILISVG